MIVNPEVLQWRDVEARLPQSLTEIQPKWSFARLRREVAQWVRGFPG